MAALRVLVPPGSLPRLGELHVDVSVCAFTFLVSVLSALLFGLGPAVSASSTTLTESLKDGGRAGESRASGRVGRTLVVSQVALSMLLVVGAGLLLRSFQLLESVATGVDAPPEQVVTMLISPNSPRYRSAVPPAGGPPQPNRPLVAYWDQLTERVRILPGVESASVSTTLPPDQVDTLDGFEIEGKPMPADSKPPAVPVVIAGPDYLKTLGIRLLRGRWFDRGDHLESARVTVISDALARQFLPGEDPVGKRLPHRPGSPFMEIVGVVSDVKYQGLHNRAAVVYYESSAQVPTRSMWLLVRSPGSDAAALVMDVRREISTLDANVPVERVKTMSQGLADSVSSPRFRSMLMAVFAAAALLLAAMGIYGVVAYTVTQRSQEIGVRMALGSTSSGIARLMVAQGCRLAGAGIALGLIGSLGLTACRKSQSRRPNCTVRSLMPVAVSSWSNHRRQARVHGMQRGYADQAFLPVPGGH